MGVCVLPQFSLLVTAGEDTTLRLHSLTHPRHLRPLGVLRSHLSGVRALCLVERRGSEITACVGGGGNDGARNSAKGSEVKQRTDGTQDDSEFIGCVVDGDNDGARSDNGVKDSEVRQRTDGTQDNSASDDNSAWMVSAGGRAEVKIWHCIINKSAKARNPISTSPCGTPEHLPGQTSAGDQDDLSVTCREVGSHMLRTGSHKTWRHQHLTFDPETRYMDAAAFWVTSSLALVALASSDGFLRSELFFLHMIILKRSVNLLFLG